jgi:hypothetical protein
MLTGTDFADDVFIEFADVESGYGRQSDGVIGVLTGSSAR